MPRHLRSKRRKESWKRKEWALNRDESYSPQEFMAPLPEDLSGHVFLIGNTILGIPKHLKLRHPCCILYEEAGKVYVSKGTALSNILPHYRNHYVIVGPDGLNGLGKLTAFEKFLRVLPRRCLFGEDCLGRLSEKDLQRIREALGRYGKQAGKEETL